MLFYVVVNMNATLPPPYYVLVEPPGSEAANEQERMLDLYDECRKDDVIRGMVLAGVMKGGWSLS